MNGQEAAALVRQEQKLLMNLLAPFSTEHGAFRPAPGMMTVAQQINHTAHTIHWFREGAFGAGFDLDFDKLETVNCADISLEEAMKVLEAQYASYIAFLEEMDEVDLCAPMPDNPIFGAAPRYTVLGAQGDHTAHHRGALSVYLRLLGVTPPMIYQE